MTMVGVRWRVLAASMLTSVAVPTIQGQSAGPNIQTECLAFGLSANGSRSDIYCMDLYGTPDCFLARYRWAAAWCGFRVKS